MPASMQAEWPPGDCAPWSTQRREAMPGLCPGDSDRSRSWGNAGWVLRCPDALELSALVFRRPPEDTAVPIHDRPRVDAGIFHAFHDWITEIARALNRGVLPASYYALPEQI